VQQQKLKICSGRLPLEGKAALLVENNALIAMSVEACLLDADVAVVKIANSIASAKSALDEGIQFDVAIVDLILEDGNATPLFQVLSGRGIPVVITTGDEVDQGLPAQSKAITILQKKALSRQGPYQCPHEMRGSCALGAARDPTNPITRRAAWDGSTISGGGNQLTSRAWKGSRMPSLVPDA
jgi:CheY-like chemotaxis protein